jgi:hypothetical protein
MAVRRCLARALAVVVFAALPASAQAESLAFDLQVLPKSVPGEAPF